ncbi:hypothetical protein HUJ05_013165 [Dendroctonus ponderosae]|nr:hypothetical protein HUJ05_013165 [Dendroctonus ponderosae]
MNFLLLQARFQQKQMQEKEEKLSKLYESQQQRAFEKVGRGSAGSNASTTSVGSTGGGKVRQMFEERRKAGVDKSYPLEPLKTKTVAKKPIADNHRNITSTTRSTAVRTAIKKTVTQINNSKPIVSQKETFQRVYNNNYQNGNYEENTRVVESFDEVDGHDTLVDMMNNHNIHDNLEDEDLPKIGFNDNYPEKPLYMRGKLANVGGKLPSQREEKQSKPAVMGLSQRNGVVKHESKVATKKPIAKTVTSPRSNSVSSTSSQSSRNSPVRSENNNMPLKQQMSSAPQRAPSNGRPSSKQTAKTPVVRDDLSECRYCGRRFATDRLGVHEDICGKTGKKKRKAYDATKHRLVGTELEGYVLKPGKKAASSKKIKVMERQVVEPKVSAKQSASKAGSWRRTHEEFIATIRAAKLAQAYVAKGGKLSDLPPPPPSTNPDYVECPHCGRRFNESAAARHIPKCATYDFNKPKNSVQKSRPGKR